LTGVDTAGRSYPEAPDRGGEKEVVVVAEVVEAEATEVEEVEVEEEVEESELRSRTQAACPLYETR